MPHSRASTTAEAFLLAGVGGCVDAVGLLTLGGLFVSHMSGNSAALGAFFGQGDWTAGWPHLFAVPVFVLGLFLGYVWITENPSMKRCAAIFLGEAALLSLFLAALLWRGLPGNDTRAYFLMATLPLIAMGLQNATLRQIGRSVFPSTYITGVLDTLGRLAAEYWHKRHTPEAPTKWLEMWSAFGVWFFYALGAVGGGAGILFLGEIILVAPIAVLLGLAWKFLRVESLGLGK